MSILATVGQTVRGIASGSRNYAASKVGTKVARTAAKPLISKSNPVGVTFNASAGRWQRTGGAKAGKFVKGAVAQRYLNALPAPPKAPGLMAKHGKQAAAGLVAGGAGFGMIANKTGKAVDPATGLASRGISGY